MRIFFLKKYMKNRLCHHPIITYIVILYIIILVSDTLFYIHFSVLEWTAFFLISHFYTFRTCQYTCENLNTKYENLLHLNNEQLLLFIMFLVWNSTAVQAAYLNRCIHNVVWFNMNVSAQPSPNLGQWCYSKPLESNYALGLKIFNTQRGIQ